MSCSCPQVEDDLRVVREALELIPDPAAESEAAVTKEITAIFEPVKDQTWHTGRTGNRTA